MMLRARQALFQHFWISRGSRLSTFGVLNKASDLISSEPVWEQTDETELPPRTTIPLSLAKHLEQLSLVHFESTKAITRLESAIRFADPILLVDTEGVEPLVSILEDQELPMRDDEVSDTDSNIVKLASEVFEDYYVAPMGNILYTGEEIPDAEAEK